MDATIQKLFTEATTKANLLHKFAEIYEKPEPKAHKGGHPKLDLTPEEREIHVKELRRLAAIRQGERTKKKLAIAACKRKFDVLDLDQQTELLLDLIKQVSIK